MELSGGVVEVDSGGDVADGSVDLKVRFHVLLQPGPVPGKMYQAGDGEAANSPGEASCEAGVGRPDSGGEQDSHAGEHNAGVEVLKNLEDERLGFPCSSV